jgi:hypothetical protein
MTETTTPEKVEKQPRKRAAKADEEVVKEIQHGPYPDGNGASAEEQIAEADEALEILEPKAEAKRWIIGKPPQEGGKETQYSLYIQQPLGFMARNRLYALIGRTMATAIKTTGGSVGGMDDIFGQGGGTIVERSKRLSQRDFVDASQFFSLALELVGYAPDFLSEAYAIMLDVPYGERNWFKDVIEQPARPDDDKWGLSEDDGLEMIEIFIDQNYEDIRRFFTEKLPRITQRASQREQDHQKKTLPESE